MTSFSPKLGRHKGHNKIFNWYIYSFLYHNSLMMMRLVDKTRRQLINVFTKVCQL